MIKLFEIHRKSLDLFKNGRNQLKMYQFIEFYLFQWILTFSMDFEFLNILIDIFNAIFDL